MRENRHRSDIRRKDYMATLAVVLFIGVLIMELLLVTWLPSKLASRKLWDRQVALQEMIDLEDHLRRFIRGGLKYKNSWQEGEGYMALNALDVLAKYIREHRHDMTREQIQEVYTLLTKIDTYYRGWQKDRYNITFEKIHIEPILNQQLEDFKKWETENAADKK